MGPDGMPITVPSDDDKPTQIMLKNLSPPGSPNMEKKKEMEWSEVQEKSSEAFQLSPRRLSPNSSPQKISIKSLNRKNTRAALPNASSCPDFPTQKEIDKNRPQKQRNLSKGQTDPVISELSRDRTELRVEAKKKKNPTQIDLSGSQRDPKTCQLSVSLEKDLLPGNVYIYFANGDVFMGKWFNGQLDRSGSLHGGGIIYPGVWEESSRSKDEEANVIKTFKIDSDFIADLLKSKVIPPQLEFKSYPNGKKELVYLPAKLKV